MNFNLENLTTKQLLQLENQVIEHLLERGLVRTRNKPIGDLAEAAVSLALGGTLAANSKASFDFEIGDKRVQVKALQLSSDRAISKFQFSAFREPFGFDTCVFVVFDNNSDIDLAIEVGVPEIKMLGRFSSHTNSYTIRYIQILELGEDKRGDVTELVQRAWNKL